MIQKDDFKPFADYFPFRTAIAHSTIFVFDNQMRPFVVICSVCIALLADTGAIAVEPSLQSILTAVQRSIPSATSVTPPKDAATFFAGHFSSSPEVARRAGNPMHGDDLYLLPDQTYFYLSWTDLSAHAEMEDKGHWRFDGQFIRTQSDHTIPRRTPFHDHAFVPLFAAIAGTKSLYLLETSQDFARFVKETKPGDDFSFLLFARTRVAPIRDAATSRAKILKDAGPAASTQ